MRWGLGGLTVVAVAVVLWLAWPGGDAEVARIESGEVARAVEPEPSSAPAPAEAPPARAALEEETSDPEPEAPAPAAGAEAPPPSPATAPDLQARVPIEIRVVDPDDVPVPEAEVTIGGMRREGDSGSWYGYRGQEPVGRTDLGGRVRLEHLEWVNLDGRARAVDLRVSHPDFAPFRDSSFPVGAGEHEVVLRRGATVVVSGWIGAPSNVVTELELEVDREARLPADAWAREPDGRLSTTRIPPGEHLVRASYESAEHGVCFSEVTPFELAEGGYEVLGLELRPALALRGELEPGVPRPVVDGHVQVILTDGGGGQRPGLHRRFEAPIEADGTFVVEGLPPGSGFVFALCRGWCSKETRAESPAQVGLHLPPSTPRDTRTERERAEEALERMGERARTHQRVQLPPPDPPLLLLMEPTGAVEVRVLREDGQPAVGATVYSSPNVHVSAVGSWIVPWREWRREVDATGRARIDDLPATEALFVSAGHPELQMREEDREERVRVAVRPGETTELELVLEPK